MQTDHAQLAWPLGGPAAKLPRFALHGAFAARETGRQENLIMQRFGLALVLSGLALTLGVVAMLLSNGLVPGHLPPHFAAYVAGGGGLLLVLGLNFLERGRDASQPFSG
jgi:hypothetical protein